MTSAASRDRPGASVIIRTLNVAEHLERLVADFRRQTVEAEIIMVDSGSTDGTVALAQRLADRFGEIPPGAYRPGRALNVGAALASADVHVAFSAHCHLPDRRWLERSLALYDDPRVGATNGTHETPEGMPIVGVYLQDREHGRSIPTWGYSNHAATWRAEVWRAHPFDESLPTAEDRIWSWEILDAGWLIAYDPSLWVDMSHRWRKGTMQYFRRCREEEAVLAGHADLPAYGARELLRQWLVEIPDTQHSPWFHRANPRRFAGLAGTYLGRRSPYRPVE